MQDDVIWNYMLPEELPKTYSLAEVSKFSRNYLMDYPVFVWEHDEGLVVVGYPKDSLAKYQHILPTSWVSSLPLKIVSLLVGNIALALLLSLFIGSRLIRSIRPITQGIQGLAEDTRGIYRAKRSLGQSCTKCKPRIRLIAAKKREFKEQR